MRVEIQCEDRIGMVREALDLFIPHGIDMRLVEVDTKRRCIYCGFPDIPFPKLQQLLADIRRLESVEDVKTVMFTPSEREHNAIYTLLEALPDGVISVDLKGYITMATELAAEDLNVSVADLLHQPLQRFIKGVNLAKDIWANPREGMTKRIRIRNKTLLLEMKPIFVSDDDGVTNPAGTVIYLKSKTRLDRQTASLKRAPDAEAHFEAYFKPSVIKSEPMRKALAQAKAFADVSMPLLVQGEMGTGKRDLIDALFQYWNKQQGELEAQLIVRNARDITGSDIATLDQMSGWLVIEDIEHLDEGIQVELAHWLARQPGTGTSLDSNLRIISTSVLSQAQLADGKTLHSGLYFSLATLVLAVPALRDRREDLEGLVQQIISTQAERYRLPVASLSKPALIKLALYHWPGNLKELQNTCLQTLLTAKNREWTADDIHLPEDNNAKAVSMVLQQGSLEKTVKQWEADLLKQLYPSYPSTRRLAKAVGMSHSAIANKLKEYDIKI
ncbi:MULTISPECIES: TyrR/PhhR family helix-turn-helix DNA-binding protein [Marinomonas]|uniref:Transcriptional regulator of aroF, aroG, tyrA and aromatic amino acid transport n=1 Tax=Marinomonas alcarazii TaxID=491949 RepID=A0A318V3P4_9GAMM|nr:MULTISPECIES: TyrR/PhhR family helix-turn-helix DNA-binding protein [Marinomonas]PYF83214.1 transcriptional regulator of aroF, aroG, tyrA and aromatic amino acid transport [Marinomonas alcarazii]